MTRTIAVLATVALLVLAGCAGGTTSGGAGSGTPDTTATNTGAHSDASASNTGSVNFYVSDERNAIEQFEHLNVTITRIGLKRTGGTEGSTEADANASASAQVEVNASAAANATGGDASVGANTTARADASAETNASVSGDASSESSDGGWVTHEVDHATVDLTELQGAKATKLGQFDASGGEYTAVYVRVSSVEGTLKGGETVDVKLPSQKLRVNKGFSLRGGEQVDFVFDITVHEAGKSGKFVVRPVVGESGADVELEEVARGGAHETTTESADGESTETASEPADGDSTETASESTDDHFADASDLRAAFVGAVAAGENATVKVTDAAGDPVEGATLQVDGEIVARTNADGEANVLIPADAETAVVVVAKGDAEVTLERPTR